MKKKFFCLLLTICMIFAFTACASADDSDEIPPPGPTVEESTEKETEVTEGADETRNEFGFTESQMNLLYEHIKKSVAENYLKPNNIAAEDFVWPEEGHTEWYYLVLSLSNYAFGSENNAEEIIGVEIDNELMDVVCQSFIDWSEEAGIPSMALDAFSMGNASSSIGSLIIENVSLLEESEIESETESK